MPKYLRLCSDVHLNFDVQTWQRASNRKQLGADELSLVWQPAPLPEDAETVLVIAGDLWHDRKFLTRRWSDDGLSWLGKLSKRFESVVYVLGNHDYWGANLLFEPDRCREEAKKQGLDNVHLLEASSVVLGNVKLLGGTLWTDFDDRNPIVMAAAPGTMQPDYKLIKYGPAYTRVQPWHFYEVFRRTREFIFKNAVRDDPSQKVVVVTHMAPCFLSVHEKFKRTQFDLAANFYYYSDLSDEVLSQDQIDLWVHGHMHDPSDYALGTTRVVANPRGYTLGVGQRETETFNETWRLTL